MFSTEDIELRAAADIAKKMQRAKERRVIELTIEQLQAEKKKIEGLIAVQREALRQYIPVRTAKPSAPIAEAVEAAAPAAQ